ncbi:luciferase domain-containing protein [Actinomadura macra]|uniref:luciferase domain-containing protein n=1 Tax=Actinomadura macra TaxID=46164 RepID=UPI000830EC92|nr:luciferase family protein [Actinomadura macra]
MGPPLPDRGFADRALRQLRGWPALTVCQADDGAGNALALRTHQIVHLHSEDEAEVLLTLPVVQRMAEALSDCSQVIMEPGGWVRVRLDGASDVILLVSLVSVAIKANITGPAAPHPTITPCPHAMTAAV